MIKESREKKGYSQEEVARKIEISLRNYQKIESYKVMPSVITAIKLSNLLGRSIELLWKDYIK